MAARTQQYTDAQMAAFSKIAYMDLNDAFQANGGPVLLSDVLTPSQVADLREIGFEPADYAGWKIVDVYDTNSSTGFYCCTIETSPGKAAVAYRGSEGMENSFGNLQHDWMEADLGLLNSTQTSQHAQVDAFLASRKELLDKYNLAMTGHSLGGNLADYATIVSGNYGLSDNVTQSVSLDGPGFSDEFIAAHQQQIQQMAGKMDHVQWSLVGSLLTIPSGVNKRVGDVQNRPGDNYNIATRHDMKYLHFNSDGSIAKGSRDFTSYVSSVISKGLDALPSWAGNYIKNSIESRVLAVGYVLHKGKEIWNGAKEYFGKLFSGGKKAGGGSSGGGGGGGGGRSFASGAIAGIAGNANVIKVSTEDMEACITRYMNEKERLMNALSICNNAAQTLARSWAGPSFLQMSLRLADTWKNLSQSMTKIDDAVNELKKTISIMERTEKSVKASASSLDVGVSPFA